MHIGNGALTGPAAEGIRTAAVELHHFVARFGGAAVVSDVRARLPLVVQNVECAGRKFTKRQAGIAFDLGLSHDLLSTCRWERAEF